MNMIEICLLGIMLFFGIWFAYIDIRKGIVPNKGIIPGFILVIALRAIYFINWDTTIWHIWLLYVLVADIIACLLYIGHIWGAGDTKLFFFMEMCIPVRYIREQTLNGTVFPYIYIFIFAFIWVLVDSIWHSIHQRPKYNQKINFKTYIVKWICVVIESLAIRSIISLLIPPLGTQNMLFYSALMLIYAYICSNTFLSENKFIVFIHLIVFIVMTIFGYFRFSVVNLLLYPLIILLIFLQRWESQYNYMEIPTETVESGMILSATSVLMLQNSRIKGLPNNPSENNTARLTDSEADAIHRWSRSVNGKPTIVIVKKIPFAIFIVLGFIIMAVYSI